MTYTNCVAAKAAFCYKG